MELNLYESAFGAFTLKARLPFISLVWEERYNESGSMQAVFPRTDKYAQVVTVGTFAEIYRFPDLKNTTLMYIHSVQTTENEIWAYGYEAKELLKKQLFIQQHGYGKENLLTMFQTLEGFIGYTWFDGIVVSASDLDTSINIDAMEFSSAYDFIQSICAMYDKGFAVLIDHDEHNARLYIYEGEDRSNKLIFSPPLGNLSGYSRTDSDLSYVDRVYVIGSDSVITYWDKDNPTGETYSALLDLREEFPRPEDMSVADYTAALTVRAKQSLAQRKLKVNISVGDIDVSNEIEYLSLGNLCRIVIPDIGVNAIKRIDTITFKFENGTETKKITIN